MEKFINKIKKLRAENQLTTRELADAIGVSQSYLSQLENGYRAKPPSSEVIKNLSSALNYDYFTLMRLAGYFPKDTNQNDLIEDIPLETKKLFLIEKGISIDGINDENIGSLFLTHFKESASIGDWVKLLRESTGKSYVRLAVESDLTTEEVIDIESGNYVPSNEKLLKLGMALGAEDLPKWVVLKDVKAVMDGVSDRRKENIELVFHYPKWEWAQGDSPYEKVESEIMPEEARQRFLYLENLLSMDENIFLNKRLLTKSQKQRALKILQLVFEEEKE